MDNMFDEARLWVEFWNEAENRWCYHNAVLNEVRSEPPRKGYTMADGRLVLENGLVVEDPLSKLTEEEKEERRAQKLCVECEAKDASRLCRQCNDKYCTSCFVKTHAGGKRAAHTYLQIGPIDCSECEGQVRQHSNQEKMCPTSRRHGVVSDCRLKSNLTRFRCCR
jgi:hypothetical protein